MKWPLKIVYPEMPDILLPPQSTYMLVCTVIDKHVSRTCNQLAVFKGTPINCLLFTLSLSRIKLGTRRHLIKVHANSIRFYNVCRLTSNFGKSVHIFLKAYRLIVNVVVVESNWVRGDIWSKFMLIQSDFIIWDMINNKLESNFW